MKKGNSLIEIIIAMSVFALVLSALGTLAFSSQYFLEDAIISKEARAMVRSNLEEAESNLRENFYNILATSTKSGVFTENILTIDIDNFTKEIKSIVRWSINDRVLSTELHSLISNPQEAFGQSDCNFIGTENWESPAIYSGPDLGFGNQATGIFARNGYVYISVNNANPRDKKADPNDFFIIDAHNPSNPTIASRLDTGPGLSTLVIAGNYAYLGNTSINAQLQIVDISNASDPKIVSSFKLPGSYSDATTIANSIFYHEGKIFIGTAKSQIEELHIIDVENSLHPIEIGKWEVNSAVNNIYVNNHYLYLATPNSEELSVLDIIDPSHLKKISGFDASGGSGNGKSLGRDRNILYLGRTVGKDELFALDISNPNALKSLGSKAILDSINGLVVYNSKAFLATNNKFEVLNTATSSNIQLISTVLLPSKATGISCSGTSFFVSLQSSDGLRIITPSI